MSIRAILRDGKIQPLDPLPTDWAEGQELVIEEPERPETDAILNEWAAELEKGASSLPPEEHDQFQRAIEEVERESKQAVARQWGLS